MTISSTPAVQAATAAAQGPQSDALNMLVLKKALNLQAAGAAALIDALPQPPSLATSGALGRHVNTFA